VTPGEVATKILSDYIGYYAVYRKRLREKDRKTCLEESMNSVSQTWIEYCTGKPSDSPVEE
jgi:hypothetical protein